MRCTCGDGLNRDCRLCVSIGTILGRVWRMSHASVLYNPGPSDRAARESVVYFEFTPSQWLRERFRKTADPLLYMYSRGNKIKDSLRLANVEPGTR